MDVVTIEQVKELEQTYRKACNESGPVASGAVEAFKFWYAHACALFSRYFTTDDNNYSVFLKEYPEGRSYAYKDFFGLSILAILLF